MSFLTPLIAIPWPAVAVVIYVVSPVTASLLFAKLTSPLELLSPVKAKLTLLSWATLTASVSFVPAARPVI